MYRLDPEQRVADDDAIDATGFVDLASPFQYERRSRVGAALNAGWTVRTAPVCFAGLGVRGLVAPNL